MKKEAENRKRMPPVDDKTAENMKTLAGFGFSPEVIGEKCGGYSGTVVRKLAAAGFDIPKYKALKKEENSRKQQRSNDDQAGETLPGQIEMELVETKPAEMTDQVKLMRFQAAQVDKLSLKLDHLNDTLHQILRVLRKE